MHTVSAIVPNYNGQKLLEKHIFSVLKILRNDDELVIVDDASTDNSWEWLLDTFELLHASPKHLEKENADVISECFSFERKKIQITLVRNFTNQRFAVSCNLGVMVAKGKYVFLLNSDVSPQGEILDQLLTHFKDPAVFAVGCLEKEDGKTGGKNVLSFLRGRFIHRRAEDFSSGETAWVSGGSGLFDRQKWLKLGGFDPRFYPAYWEDIDLSATAKKHGWKVLFDEKAVVEHHHETTNQSVFGQQKIDQVSWKNGETFLMKHGTFTQKMLFFLWKPYWWWKVMSKQERLYAVSWLTIVALATLLRFYKLAEVPHGMTWDEASIGYNGYAIWATHRDEWLAKMPISFRSFGDYKAPLAIYVSSFVTSIFGLNLWAIRLPFALAGVFSVVGIMALIRLLFADETQEKQRIFSLLGGLLLCISVWHIHFSRIAFESGLSLLFVIWGMYLLLKLIKQKDPQFEKLVTYAACSGVFLTASLYTYHAAKIVLPLLIPVILILYLKEAWQKKWFIFGTGVGSLLLSLPLIKDSLFSGGVTRFSQVSILTSQLSFSQKCLVLTQNFLQHFSLQYLIFGSTLSLRHGDGMYGILSPVTLFVIVMGILLFLFTFRKQNTLQRKNKVVIYLLGIAWVVIGVLPGAIGEDVPHSNRTLLSLGGFILLAVAGCDQLSTFLKESTLNAQLRGSHGEKDLLLKTVIGVLVLVESLFFCSYLHHYYTDFASQSASDFDDGYIEAMKYVYSQENSVDKILFTSEYGQPYIYQLVVSKTNPIWYQGGSQIKYEFTNKISTGDFGRKNTLIVAAPDQIEAKFGQKLILGSDGKVRFVIIKTEP